MIPSEVSAREAMRAVKELSPSNVSTGSASRTQRVSRENQKMVESSGELLTGNIKLI